MPGPAAAISAQSNEEHQCTDADTEFAENDTEEDGESHTYEHLSDA